jgi:hypothetical protein
MGALSTVPRECLVHSNATTVDQLQHPIQRPYPTHIKVTDEQLAAVHITRHPSHGDWNYTINPSPKKS